MCTNLLMWKCIHIKVVVPFSSKTDEAFILKPFMRRISWRLRRSSSCRWDRRPVVSEASSHMWRTGTDDDRDEARSSALHPYRQHNPSLETVLDRPSILNWELVRGFRDELNLERVKEVSFEMSVGRCELASPSDTRAVLHSTREEGCPLGGKLFCPFVQGILWYFSDIQVTFLRSSAVPLQKRWTRETRNGRPNTDLCLIQKHLIEQRRK